VTESLHSDIATMSFEQAMQELEAIVRRLEAGDTSLDASLNDYGRGTALKAHCAKTLNDAKLKVETIVKQADGTLATAAFDA
jgi:exodeoxyribonuclease VII small subunit